MIRKLMIVCAALALAGCDHTPQVFTSYPSDTTHEEMKDWAEKTHLNVTETLGGHEVLVDSWADPDTGCEYLYFWDEHTASIAVVPRMSGHNSQNSVPFYAGC